MTAVGTTTGTRRGRGYWAPHTGRAGGTGSLPRGEALYVSVPAGALPVGSEDINRFDVKQPTGAPIRGTVISPDDPRIPKIVFHVTTARDAVERSGVLRARGIGGLGGDRSDQIVSLTINEDIADQLAADLRMSINFCKCKAFANQPEGEWDAVNKEWRWFRDGVEVSRADMEARSRQMAGWLRNAAQNDSYSPWDCDLTDMMSLGSDPRDFLGMFFQMRSSWDWKHEGQDHKRQNPVIHTDWEILAKLDPEQVGVIRIPKANLKAAGALITDFDLGQRHLEEIRVYGDVPVKARGTKAGPGRGYWNRPGEPHRGRPGGRGSRPRGGGEPWQQTRDEYALSELAEVADAEAGGLYTISTHTAHFPAGGGVVNDFVQTHEQGHHLFHDVQNISVTSMLQDRPDVMAEIADTGSGRSHFGRQKLDRWNDNPEDPRNYDWVETLADLWAEYKFGRLKEYPALEQWLDAIVPAYQEHRSAVERALATGKSVPAKVLRDYPDLAKQYAVKAGPGRGYWAPHRGREGGTGSAPRGGAGVAADLGPFASQAALDIARYGVRSWDRGYQHVEQPTDLSQAIYVQEKLLVDNPDVGLTVSGPYDAEGWRRETVTLTRAQSEFVLAEMKAEYAAYMAQLRQKLGWSENWRDLIPDVPLDQDPWNRDVQSSAVWNAQMDAFHDRAVADMQRLDPSQFGEWDLRSKVFEFYKQQAAAELSSEQAAAFAHWADNMGQEYGLAQEFEIQHMISAGKLTPEEANANTPFGTSGWSPLPRELYHVTTNVGAIQADRIRSRWESGQRLGLGLGGGDNNTISLTTSRKMAGVIEQSLHEAHLVAKGDVTMQRLVELAQAGYGTEGRSWVGWLARAFTNGENEYNDVKYQRPDYDPFKDGMPHGMASLLEMETGKWQDPPEKVADRRWGFFRDWLRARQAASGAEDPLFFGTDWQGLAQADPRQFGVLTYKPKQGARGKQMSGLAEWRVVGGDVVALTDVQYDHLWDQMYEDMTGKPYRWRQGDDDRT